MMSAWLELLAPAWLMGSLLPFLTAPLGCLMLWRRMAFFADTMAHGTLLGVAVAAFLHVPLWLGVIAVALLLVATLTFLHDRRLPTDALLALCSATLLCSGLLMMQQVPSLRSGIMSYLFGDLLAVSWQMLPLFALTILLTTVVLWRVWRAQLKLAIAEDIARSEGINANLQRLIFMLILAIFTVLALKVVGSLLMGALLVIPALTARLMARSPQQMVIAAFVVAELCIATGLWGSAWLDLATGLSIVLCMGIVFFVIFMIQKYAKLNKD